MNKKDQEHKQSKDVFDKLDCFPGSLQEYCDFKGEEYELMDTQRPEKYINLSEAFLEVKETDLIKRIIKAGCSGFIRFHKAHGHMVEYAYGIPVRKKNSR